MSPDRACPPGPSGPPSQNTGPARPTGFTLIELLVVIFIISLLVAATLTIIPKVKRAVYSAETQAQLAALANAINQYYNDYKSYPGPLPNNQLNWAADSLAGNQPSAYGYTLSALQPFPAGPPSYNPPTTNTGNVITGAQNLVLGLLGGLELTTASGAVNGFVYNPQDIFSDGVTPAPRGPSSLNFSSPRRQQAYIQVKAGDLSTPNTAYNGGNGASFQDEAMRSPQDSMIPVFLDKYSNPMPILYYRTNVGGTAIVGFRKGGAYVDDNNNGLVDPALAAVGAAPPEVAQYDLDQNLPYVKSKIGTIASNANSLHGLIGLGNSSNLSDPIDINVGGTYVPGYSAGTPGYNAIAYFKDPSLNPPYDPTVDTSVTNTPSNTHLGVARQKDGYLLISAGPDRLYGTHDDNVYPGPLQP